LRILFLAPQPFFEVRGTPLAVLSMVRTLVILGHSVDLLTYPQGETLEVAGVTHYRSLRLPVGRVKAGPSFAKLALDIPFTMEAILRMILGRYDVVHAVEEAAHLVGPIARLVRLPLVVDVDSSIPDQLRYSGFATRGPLLWTARALERYAFSRAAAVITVCKSLTEGVRATAPGARVFQVEDAPLVSPSMSPTAASLAAFRESLGVGTHPVVLYSGNFEPYQGVEALVDASAELPEARFVFVGGEPHEIEALKNRASRHLSRCIFCGKRSPTELPLFLGVADVLVSPRSRGGNTPFKIYTYLASGKPLVATRIPTHTQLLDESLAFLVDLGPQGLASGIRQALADPIEAGSRARRAQALVEREYSAERYAEKVKQAYDVVAAS
jgi:glycosyltransferase involved in cell wall biosynthesis